VDSHLDDFAMHGVAETVLAAVMLAGALLYARGVWRLWRRAGAGRGIGKGEAMNFALGWIALAASLLGPIDEWAETSFAMHMVQHELLMVVAAPLMVLGRPLEAWTWGVSLQMRRPLSRMRGWVQAATQPFAAWLLHALALWMWHLPVLFDMALRSFPVHVLQHACFLGTALLYWWSVFGRSRTPRPSAVASLFTTMLHTSALGALLTFATSPWYGAGDIRAFGLSALEDQQLGGLIMWVPGGLAYLFAGLALVARSLSPNRAQPAARNSHA
jgi:putative membrane protein